MISPRSQLINLIEQRAVPVEKIGDALKATTITPDGAISPNPTGIKHGPFGIHSVPTLPIR